jgi:hypothetical protein
MTIKRDKEYSKSESRNVKFDKCFLSVEEATRERQRIIDKEPYS